MKKKYPLNVYEFGTQNKKIILLLHPSVVKWDYFEYIIPLLEKKYHLIIPAIPGYDFKNKSEFTSVEEIALQIGNYLKKKNIHKVEVVYGCSMGGSIALRMAMDRIISIHHIILDGGITPYQLPWILTRCILLRDFLILSIGKLGGKKILIRAFTTDKYNEDSIQYIEKVLKHMTYKTIWRTFDSCNNYKMPKKRIYLKSNIYYWCAENELKERAWDIKYMKTFIPNTRFMIMKNIGHGGLALLKPEKFASKIIQLIK